MKRFSTLLLFLFLHTWFGETKLFAQARLVLNNNPYIVFADSAYLVLDNDSTNAITLLHGIGNIISENEFARVKWNIHTSTGAYTIPFTTSADTSIPLTVNITTPGSGNGSILFSTYGDSSWDDLLYRPSDVTNMNSNCCTDNSADVVDRFWEIDAINYTTKPSVNITFTYAPIDWNAFGNTITETALFAQRFNTTLGWGDWTGSYATDNPTNRSVSSGPVTSSNFFRSWTLVDQGSPLPIQLLYFTANCDNGNILISWATASQSNNAYFTIERSQDAVNWIPVSIIDGAGTNVETITYQFVDSLTTHSPSQLWYYRLQQTDYNGHSQYFNAVVTSCTQSIDLVNIYPNPVHGFVAYVIGSSVDNTEVTVEVFDLIGQKVNRDKIYVDQGISTHFMDVSELSRSAYVIRISLNDGGLSKSQKEFIVN